MIYLGHYNSPLGPITLASDGEFLTGLWFDGQKYDRYTLRNMKPGQIFDLGLIAESEGQSDKQTDEQSGKQTDKQSGKQSEQQSNPQPSEQGQKENSALEQTGRWLDLYFSGHQPDFTPPLKIEGSDFKKLVAEIMLAIPCGGTMTYGEIAAEAARRMGRERMSAQAVGGAVGHNAISIIIPCHRVTGSDGSLTGYAGGLERKKWLLEMEKALNFNTICKNSPILCR